MKRLKKEVKQIKMEKDPDSIRPKFKPDLSNSMENYSNLYGELIRPGTTLGGQLPENTDDGFNNMQIFENTLETQEGADKFNGFLKGM